MIWCLHGAVGQAGDWDRFSLAMAEKGESCRAVELWRYLECEGLSLNQWAKAFNAEVRAAGEVNNLLVGYSMGGRLALHALLDDPDLWGKAVIISSHPGLKEEQQRLERMADDAAWAGQALTAEWKLFLQNWDRQGVLQGGEKEEPDARMRLVNRRRAIARSFMEWSLGKQADLWGELKEVRCPVLWMTGKRDQKFTDLAQEAVPLLAKGLHEEFEAGHRLVWEKPEEFFESVWKFYFCDEGESGAS